MLPLHTPRGWLRPAQATEGGRAKARGGSPAAQQMLCRLTRGFGPRVEDPSGVPTRRALETWRAVALGSLLLPMQPVAPWCSRTLSLRNTQARF